MCTAISYKTKNHYFGRNLDLDCRFHEAVTVTPRNYAFSFPSLPPSESHYAMIGMATCVDGYPLYYDATNEYGLSIAGLNFPGNAVYYPPKRDKHNLASFELIPYLLGQYKSVSEAQKALQSINITDIEFNSTLKPTPLHWLISDKESSIVLEQTSDGLKVYNNPKNVLTNNPPFPYHLNNLNNYLNLTPNEPSNRFSSLLDLSAHSHGMGAIGLPGDLSSTSRFIRAAFVLHNSISETDEQDSVCQFFHILGSVAQQRGCVRIKDKLQMTIYSSCCNTNKGIYYYTTYHNSRITAVDMHKENLDGNAIVQYPLQTDWDIKYVN